MVFAFANAGVAPCYRSLYPCLTLKTKTGGIAAVLADDGFDLSALPVAKPGASEERTHAASFTIGRWQRPIIPPGEYDLFLSLVDELVSDESLFRERYIKVNNIVK